jgi:hypothetical protein
VPDEPQEPKRKEKDEPRERTPTGYEVRTPTRREFFDNLRKASEPEDESQGA